MKGDFLFYSFAATTVLGGAWVAMSPDILRSTLGLLASLVGSAALYALLSADLLAVTWLVVHVGGVLVTILFTVMSTHRATELRQANVSSGVAGGVALASCLLPVLTFIATATAWSTLVPTQPGPSTREILGAPIVGLSHFLIVGALLFALGVLTVLTRRNAIGVLMGIELIVNGAVVDSVAFDHYLTGRGSGRLFVLFAVVLAAAEALVGLAIVLALFRTFRTVDVQLADTMRE